VQLWPRQHAVKPHSGFEAQSPTGEGCAATFDGLDYIASYGDLIKALGYNEQAGAEHFIDRGYREGRTTTFDGLAYIADYPDLMKAFGARVDITLDEVARDARTFAGGHRQLRV
jgi:hypothetical protein